MENVYQIDEKVQDRITNEIKTISEFEKIGNIILYYFKEGGALPQNRLQPPFLSILIRLNNLTDKEKNYQTKNAWKDSM